MGGKPNRFPLKLHRKIQSIRYAKREKGGKFMTIEILMNNPEYKPHHTASRRGYESRKGKGHVEEYNGKFGKGFVLVEPRYDTTQYVSITYYIKEK